MPVKHGDLTNQQISQIQKNLIVSLRDRDLFWDKFCSHTKANDGYSAYEWRKLNVTALTEADITNLTEGVTPAALPMTYLNFKVTPVDFGRHIEYTDKAKKYNFDDVVRDAKVILAQHSKENTEYRKALAYISGTCTMTPAEADITSANFDFLGDLLKVRTILKKNHVKAMSGNRFGCILPSEVAAKVLLKYKDSITHTSQKEALIDGYLGELGGFILYESVHPALYNQPYETVTVAAGTFTTNGSSTLSADGYLYTKDGTVYTKVTTGSFSDATTYYGKINRGYVLFIGKTEYGMPVQTVAFGDDSVEIINHGLGEGLSVNASGNVVADALNQHGTVGYKVMGFATRILFDEAVIRGNYKLSPVSLAVTDANRDGYQGSYTSPAA